LFMENDISFVLFIEYDLSVNVLPDMKDSNGSRNRN
jgi:hypothetical protein